MKKKALLIFLLLMFFSNIYASNFNFQTLNYSENIFSNKVENIISDALDSTLVAYTKVDDRLLDSLTIEIKNLSYDDNIFLLDAEINYQVKKLPIKIELNEADQTLLFERLYKILFNTLKYDLSILFDWESEFYLNYSGGINSFYNTNNTFRTGDFIYLENIEEDKSLATISSTFNEVAVVNYLYNTSQLVNLKIKAGPKNQLGINADYDFNNKTVSASFEYFYLKSLLSPFNTVYLGLSTSYFYDTQKTKHSFSIDSGFLIEMPLSLLFASQKFLNSSTLYSKAKVGLAYLDSAKLHVALELGYKKYLSPNLKLAIAYKIDSNNSVGNNLLMGFEVMF